MKQGTSSGPEDDSPLILIGFSIFALSRPEQRIYVRDSSSEPTPMKLCHTSPRFSVWQYELGYECAELSCDLLIGDKGLTKWKEIHTEISDSLYVFRCPVAGRRSHPIEDFTDYCIFLIETEEFDNQFDALARQFLENCSEDEMNRRKGTFPAHFSALEGLSQRLVSSMSPKALTVLLALCRLTGTPCASQNALLAVEKLGSTGKLERTFQPIWNFSERAFKQCSEGLQTISKPPSIPVFNDSVYPIHRLRGAESLPSLIKAAEELVGSSSREWQPEFNLLAASMLQKAELTADAITAEISQLSDPAKDFIHTTVLSQYCLKTQDPPSSSRTAVVYFATCPQEQESTTCVLTSCGSVTLEAVQWANPLSHPYQLRSGKCPVGDGDTELSIVVKNGGLTFSEVSGVRRVLAGGQTEYFTFASVFQSPLLTANNSYRCAEPRKSFDLYLTYLLTGTEYLDSVERLMAQYGEVDYLRVLGLMRQLQALGSAQSTEQLGLLAVRVLGACQDPAQVVTQYWKGLLKLSVDLLRTAPLQQESAFMHRGYGEIMKMCVNTRQPEWILILQRVPLTADNQHFFVPFFKQLSEDDAKYVIGEVLNRGQAVDIMYLRLHIARLGSIHTFLSIVSLLLLDERAHWSEAGCLEEVNSYLDKKTMKVEEVEGVYQQFAALPEQTRNVLQKSSLTKIVEGALKRNIEKRWMPLYELMLLGEGKRLVPALNAAEFAGDLIATHRFDFLATYTAFKSVLPEVSEVFRVWLALQRQQTLSNLVLSCDGVVRQCQGEEFEQVVAGLAANEVYAACGSLLQYLVLSSDFRFTSNALRQSCRRKSEAAISEKMRPTIIANELLSQVIELRKTKAAFASFFEAALKCLEPSARTEMLTALLNDAERNAYWVDLFKDSANHPAVLACADSCGEFFRLLDKGDLSYRDFSSLLNDAKAKRIFEVVAAAIRGRMNATQLAGRRRHWQERIEASCASIRQFHAVLERLFPRIPLPRDVQRFFPKEFPQYSAEPVASLASLPGNLQRWQVQSALFDQFLRSEVYRTWLVQRGGDPALLQADRFAATLEEARDDLVKRVKEIAKPPTEVLMDQVVSIFGSLRDPDQEIDIIKAILPEFQLDLLRGSLKCYRMITETKVLCEAVIRCEKVLEFTDQRALNACRQFKDTVIEAQNEFTLAQIIDIAKLLPSICSVDVVSHQDAAKVLVAIGQHETIVRGVLAQDEDKLITMMEMAGTQEDVVIDPKLVDNFMTVRNFVMEIMKVKSVDKLLTKVNDAITRNQRIVDLVQYCADKMPILEGIGDVIDITEKTKIEWILAMLSSSVATFKGDAVQLSISFQLSDRPPYRRYTKEADELEALQSQCVLILASSKDEEHRSKLQAFTAILSLLFQVQSKANELDSFGADVSEVKRGKDCRIDSDRSEEAERLDQQLSQELEVWRKGVAVECYALTYLFGDHVWTMEKAFLATHSMTEWQEQQASAWAKAMGKRLKPAKYEAQADTVQRLTQLGTSLERLSKAPSDGRHFSYMQDARNAPAATQQILYFETPEAFPAVVSTYVQLRRKLPKSHQVMVCMETTTLGEFLGFLRHCFTCPRPKLFALLHSHRLSSTLQTEGTRVIEQLLPLGNRSSFLVVSEDSKGHFAQFIRSKIRLWAVRELDTSFLIADFRCIQEVAPATRVLVSDVPGLGKTNYAVAQAKASRKPLFIFPVSGELEAEALCQSLCERRVSEHSSLLIQIGYVEPASHHVLESFLLQVVVLLSFKTRKSLFVLPADCQVAFEVQSTPTKQWLLAQSPLKHLQAVAFTKINEFVPSDDEARTLAYLDLYSRNPAGLAMEVTGTVEGARCQQVIESSFVAQCRARGDSVSYRSIKSFLGFMSYQIKGLGMSVFLPGELELSTLRLIVFECFLQSTLEYTVKSMKIVREEQHLAAEHKPASAHLQCTVGWETSNHDNVFFTKSGQLVFIYKSLSRANQALHNLFSQQQAILKGARHYGQTSGYVQVPPSLPPQPQMQAPRGPPMQQYMQAPPGPMQPYMQAPLPFQSQMQAPRGPLMQPYMQAPPGPMQPYMQAPPGPPTQLYRQAPPGPPMQQQTGTQSELPNYEKMSSDELIETLRTIHCPGRTLEKTSYVMTPDNFLKMNLIYIRMLAGIPIVCMGDTGCGKTHLLTFLVNTLLGEVLEVVNIHAGVTAAEVEERMAEIVQRSKKQGRVWVFFDEFNTSACMGAVCEIVCDRRLSGVDLPGGLVFVAACNPYRLKPQAMLSEKRAGIKHKSEDPAQRQLLHVVKPLPESLLEYVWDFGGLASPDLKKYIRAILAKDSVENLEQYCEAVFYAHGFLVEKLYASSVSLRDVKRFVIIYKWLLQMMQAKSKLKPKYLKDRGLSIPRDIAALPLATKAGAVAYYLTYIMRISVKDNRDKLAQEAARILGVGSLQAIVQAEQDELIARMELPKDIVANEALRENLYTLFVCIYTRIPAILCGKPGCSKSLAYQCLFDNCRNRYSSDEWLKTLPGLVFVYFQGSVACTSDAVLKSFSRGKKINKALADKLAVVVFDEIGLAELSPHNPLKVLHKELELDNAEERQGMAFVGISNWALDASKMNRMLHISRPDPTLEEVQYTALKIFNALASSQSKQYSSVAEAAAKAYFNIKSKIQDKEWEDFYGLRDFYHLVKLIVRSLNELKARSYENVAKAVNFAVQRNFGGRREVAAEVWRYIVGDYGPIQPFWDIPPCGVLDLVAGNLADRGSRYLMVITDGELAEYVLEHRIGVKIDEKRVIMTGSTLPGDCDSDTYARRRLSDMITYMERGTSVILKGMDQIYSSLYDLFNQNFKNTSMGKFCRVAIGSSFKPRCFVHDDFHVILVVQGNEDSINKFDAPFLNRFEKHIFDLTLLLMPEKKALAEQVDAWVKNVLKPDGQPILLGQALIFPTYNPATIQLNILRAPESISEENLFKMLIRGLINAAPSDFLVLAELAKWKESQLLKDEWRETHSVSFAEVTEKISLSQHSLFLVFTYEFKEITDAAVETRYLAAYNTEDDLVGGVKLYLSNQTTTLYCLVLNYTTERRHFSFVKHTLQRLSQEEKSAGRRAKKLVLVVQQQRNVAHEATGSDYTGWSVLSVDCFGRDSYPLDDNLLQMNCVELITQSPLLDFRRSLKSMLYPLVFQLKYEPSALITDKSFVNKHMFLIIENFEKHEGLVDAFRSKTCQHLQSANAPERDWKERIFRDPQCVDRCGSANSAILYILEQSVRKVMAMCLFAVETKLAMRSFFALWTEPEGEVIREMWLANFSKMELKTVGNLQSSFHSNKVPFAVHLNFPFSLSDYELLRQHELRESLEKFAEAFTSRSVTKGFLRPINASLRLQYLYFCDIVSISVWKEQFSPSIEELMRRLTWSLVAEEREFVLKVWRLVSHWPLITQYCRYVLLYSEFAHEQVQNLLSTFLWKKALKKLPEGAVTLPKDLRPSQYTPDKFVDAQEVFNLPPASADAAQWKEEVLKKVNKSIRLLYPTSRTANQYPMEQWPQWLSRFEKELKGFEGPLPYLSTFETLSRFPSYTEAPETFQFFVEVCELVASDPKKPIFTSKAVQKKLKKRVDKMRSKASENTLTFRALLMTEMIRNNEEFVAILAAQVNEEEGFWKHSVVAIEALVQCSELREKCVLLIGNHGGEPLPLKEGNKWVLAIENLFHKKPGLNSHFAVLLSDRCFTVFPPSSTSTEDFLVDNLDSFRLCEAVIQRRPKELPNTSALVALTFMKWYLQVYCWVLATQSTERSKDVRDQISDILSANQLFRKVCIIYLNFIMTQQGKSTRVYFAEEREVPWLESVQKELKSDESSPLFFRVPQGKVFMQAISALHDLKESKHEKASARQVLLGALDYVHTPEEKLQFAVAFVSEISLYRDRRDSFPEVSLMLKSIKQAITGKLGASMAALLEGIVENFSPPDFAHIPRRCSETDLQHRAAAHCILAVITAFAEVEGCLTSIFFTSGGVASGNNFSSMFVPGAPHEALYEYLYAVWTNPGQFGAKSWNNCGNCDNIYAISNCGLPMEKFDCPYCKSKIGGTNHTYVNRPGHRQLAPNEVPQFAAARVQNYLNSKQKPGMSRDSSLFDAAGMRGISPLSLDLLRYIVKCYLNFLCTWCKDSSFQRAFVHEGPAQTYYDRTLKASLNSICRQLGCGEDYIWIFRLASELPGFLRSHRASPRTPAARTEFECAFDQTLVRPYTINPAEFVRQYKTTVPKITHASYEEDDSFVATDPYIRFFRITREPSEDLLISTWTLNPKPTVYPALQVAISSFKTFSTLQGIQPILDLTKYLTAKHSHRMSREEARKTPIREYIAYDERLGQLFNEFLKVWESVNSDLAFACHQLAPMDFSEETEIIYFLPDTKENGGGLYMCAALYSLADRQNRLLESLANAVAGQMPVALDSVKLSIQEIAPEHILRCALTDYEFILSCFCNNPAYACGRDVVFNYDRIEQRILTDFRQARLLSAENLHLFQYQGEFLANSSEYSSIIGDIRKLIPQRPLPAQEMDRLQQFVFNFERNDPARFKLFVQEVHDALEYVLCIVKNEKVSDRSTIAEVVGRYDVHQVCETLLKHREVSSIAVQHVVHLYEEFELLCFPLTKVNEKFTEKDKANVVVRCVGRVQKLGNLVPPLPQVRSAVMRLILRLLDESMKVTEPLGMYIVKPDLWPEDVDGEKLETLGEELTEVQMKYVHQVYTLLGK